MSQNTVRFLVELSQDPGRMEEYWQDPEAVLAATDLTAEEREILQSGDPKRLQALLGRPLPLLMYEDVRPKPPHKPKPKPKPKPAPKPAPKPRPKTEAA